MAIRLKTFDDYWDFTKRRKYYIIFTWILLTIISVIVAYNLPKIFRSTATLLIEAPIPSKILENMPLQYADEQLQSIYQKVMTSENINSVIDSEYLYSEIKNQTPNQELVELFKKNVEVELASSSLKISTATSGIASIAFNISFSDQQPVKARNTASSLARKFIELNDESRSKRAEVATDFLTEEAAKLNRQLEIVDLKIVAFKKNNSFSLPEQMQGNRQAIDRVESELKDIESQIKSAKDRIGFLVVELARIPEQFDSLNDDVTQPISKKDNLINLRSDYLKARQIYSLSHPTVKRLKREMDAFETDSGSESFSIKNPKDELIKTKDELKLKEKTYAPNHPDIVKLKKLIVSLESQKYMGFPISSKNKELEKPRNKNPGILILESQYKNSQSDLESLIQKQNFLKEKLEKLHSIIVSAPEVEMGYTDLIRERDNIINKYTQIKGKLADAKVFQTLEQGDQGRTITLLEEALIPVNPEKAIRRKVAIGGCVFGLIAGLIMAFALEYFDPSVRGYKTVAEITGLMPLVVIPYLETKEEEAKRLSNQRRINKITILSILTFIMSLSIFIVYYFTVKSLK